MFILRSRSRRDDLDYRLQLESVFYKDEIRDCTYQNDETLHVGGLYESLSSLPVYDWQDTEFDFASCRDGECEVRPLENTGLITSVDRLP